MYYLDWMLKGFLHPEMANLIYRQEVTPPHHQIGIIWEDNVQENHKFPFSTNSSLNWNHKGIPASRAGDMLRTDNMSCNN